MRLELPIFCGSFPNTFIRRVWALLRFCMYLSVLSQFCCSSVRFAAAIPRAIEVLVCHWCSAAVCFDNSIRGAVRIERVLSGRILVDRIWSIDVCSITIFIETAVKILRLTGLWGVARQRSKRLALLHFIWKLRFQMMAPWIVHRILEIRTRHCALPAVVEGWLAIGCLGMMSQAWRQSIARYNGLICPFHCIHGRSSTVYISNKHIIWVSVQFHVFTRSKYNSRWIL